MFQILKRRDLKAALATFLIVLLVAGALYSAYLFFSTMRALMARPSSSFSSPNVQAGTTLGRAPEEELPDVVEEKERINILLLGIDQRSEESGPWRTDTMILLSIDPATDSAAILSIPRDLWTTIPGFGENRINTAHFLGDQRDYPGGGVALAKKTVWHAFGVPVHYYVRINFRGFERLVDEIGGITIDVEERIHDENYPDENYGTMVVDIPAGLQQMDGETALQYARSRHGSNDFDRMKRQQDVIMAVRDKILSLDVPVSRIPKIIEVAGDTVKTDMTLEEMIALAKVAKRIDRSNIDRAVLDESMTTTVVTPENWVVEVADWSKVQELVEELFPSPVPSAAPTSSSPKVRPEIQEARIVLQNGTAVPDLAKRTESLLKERGFNVTRYENAERLDHKTTKFVLYGDNPYATDALASVLGVNPQEAFQKETSYDADIRIILGQDYAQMEAD
ncbi:MAG: LCP family protein [Anaerolineae bacterium]